MQNSGVGMEMKPLVETNSNHLPIPSKQLRIPTFINNCNSMVDEKGGSVR